MSEKLSVPVARLTMVRLGVNDMRASIAFYEALGFTRKGSFAGLKVEGLWQDCG